MKKSEFYWIAKVFIAWRILLEIIIKFAATYVPLQKDFVGVLPLANYDAEHYLSIARYSYRPLQYFYFPLYPVIVGKIATLTNKTGLQDYANIGLIVSSFAFFIALIGLYKLTRLHKSHKIARLSILALVAFPTSYYFAAVYTESLFLMCVVWSFYFFHKSKYMHSGFLGAFASAARSTGVLLAPAFFAEIAYDQIKAKKINIKKLLNYLPLVIIPAGLFIYMLYLQDKTGSLLAFNKDGVIFGEYRSPTPVLLPQVFYRYIFKIIPNLNIHYFPSLFTTLLEFGTAVLLTIFGLISIKKQKTSWWVYFWGGFIAPTLYLNFVSLPRYALVLFPLFVLIGETLSKVKNRYKFLYFSLSCLLLIIALSLFSRGYWVS